MKSEFEDLGWAAIPVEEKHDLGTDLYCQPRDTRRFDLLQLLGVQVKTGRSYFRRAASGEVAGWWYREENGDHFNYWVQHLTPHLLVLHDHDANTSYWVRVTREQLEPAGKGWKILVPSSQVLGVASLDALYAIVAEQRHQPALEGSAWGGQLATLAPGATYRHALLAPRLVAPHRSARHTKEITAVEAIALIVQGRLYDLNLFTDWHESTNGQPDSKATPDEWGWRFVEALRCWLGTGGTEQLRAVFDDTHDPPARAAAGVALACALYGEEKLDEALSVIDRLVVSDESEPIDHAWLLVQRARLRWELGYDRDAHVDALAASDCLAAWSSDVSASAIRAAATRIVWSALDPKERDVGLLVATDTAVSWWKAQTLASALSEALDAVFNDSLNDGTITFFAEDEAHNGLLAAAVGSNLSGAQSNWRTETALLAKHDLVTGHLTGDDDVIANALNDLRRSGDHLSLARVAGKLNADGPLSPLLMALSHINEGAWSRSTLLPNLALLKTGGDLLGEEAATEAAAICLRGLSGEFSHGVERFAVADRYLIVQLAAALSALLPAADNSATIRAAKWLASLPDTPEAVLSTELPQLISNLRIGVLASDLLGDVRSFALRTANRKIAARLLLWLSMNDDTGAAAELVARAEAHVEELLFGAINITHLSRTAIEKHFETLADQTQLLTDGVNPRSETMPLLTWLGFRFPNLARWDLVLRYLAAPTVGISEKSRTIDVLSTEAMALPADVAIQLREMLPVLLTTRDPPIMPEVLGEPASMEHSAGRLALTLGWHVEETIVSLSAGRAQGRTSLAEAMGQLELAQAATTLSVLAGDSDPQVRYHVGVAIARRIGDGRGQPADEALLAQYLVADGTRAARAVLAGAAMATRWQSNIHVAVDEFRRHRSGLIRAQATVLLARRVTDANSSEPT